MTEVIGKVLQDFTGNKTDNISATVNELNALTAPLLTHGDMGMDMSMMDHGSMGHDMGAMKGSKKMPEMSCGGNMKMKPKKKMPEMSCGGNMKMNSGMKEMDHSKMDHSSIGTINAMRTSIANIFWHRRPYSSILNGVLESQPVIP